MKVNNLTIVSPEGMEAYQEGDKIKFRPIKGNLSVSKIYRKLFEDKDIWRPEKHCINKYNITPDWHSLINCTSLKQAQKLLAINKLMNVAKYINGDWEPDWSNEDEGKYSIFIDSYYNNILISRDTCYICNTVYFRSQAGAKQAIEILGEETIRLALSTDW